MDKLSQQEEVFIKSQELREKLQSEAHDKLVENNGGTLHMTPGTGKSKIAIDYAKTINAKNILITSPRENLKQSWDDELAKWGIFRIDSIHGCTHTTLTGEPVNIIMENIQTVYKWNLIQLAGLDLIIADEVHTMVTGEYGKLLIKANVLKIKTVCLTGTADNKKRNKYFFYKKYCPIVYEYLDSAKDGVINKRKYIVYEHELTDNYKIEVKGKTKSWMAGEKKQYDWLQSQVTKGEDLILEELGLDRDEEEYVNYFGHAKSWYWNKSDSITASQKKAGGTYMRAVTNRKQFLWNLTSTAEIAKAMANHIISANDNNKVLVFSERTDQAVKISKHTVHSKNKADVNKKNLSDFDNGIIRQLGSCYSLTLGLNLNNTGYAINESYNGSDVQFKQKSGRVDRLPITEDAVVIFIVIKDTQSEKWFNNAVKFDDDDIVEKVNNIDGFKFSFYKFKGEGSISID